MLVLLDTSTLINLVNGGVLATVLNIPHLTFMVSTGVRNESSSIAKAVDIAVEGGHLGLVDDALITAKAFMSAKRDMGLGDGETECILVAEVLVCQVACDDRLARTWSIRRLGEPGRVTGSIGLLRTACEAGLLAPDDAFKAYELMRSLGGYLPQVDPDQFTVDFVK